MIPSGRSTRSTSSLLATLVLVVVLVASPIVGAVGPALATAGQQSESSPSGLTAIPNSNIREIMGPESNVSATAADFAGSTMASSHPESTELTVTSGNRVLGPDGEPVGTGSDLVLRISDDTNHDGRTIGVPLNVIRENVGEIPERAYGYHESGERWSSAIRREGSLLIFDVPRFSTNTVTFDGRVELGGMPNDGATLTYELADLDAVDPDSFNISVTGAEATEWDNVSAVGLVNGDTLAVNPAGDEIRGPNAGEPELVLTGEGFNRTDSATGTASPGGSSSVTIDGNLEPTNHAGTGDPSLSVTASATYTQWNGDDSSKEASFFGNGIDAELGFDTSTAVIEGVTFTTAGCASDGCAPNGETADVYIVEEKPDGTYGEGTLVESGFDLGALPNSGTYTYTLPSKYEMTTPGSPVTIEFISEDTSGSYWRYTKLDTADDLATNYARSNGTDYGTNPHANIEGGFYLTTDADGSGGATDMGYLSDGASVTTGLDAQADTSTLYWNNASGAGSIDWTLDYRERAASEDPAADYDGDGVNDCAVTGLLKEGETKTCQVPGLSPGDDTTTISLTSGTVGADVKLEEVTETQDPSVEVNGNWTNHTGTLGDGNTTSLYTDSTWIKNGTNHVNVSVGDGSLSADAPTPQVGLDYTHTATDRQSVTYDSEIWTDRYDFTKEWASDRANATASLDLDDQVVAVREIEHRVNSSTWEPAPDSAYAFDGTTLTYEFGDVKAGSTHDLRINASKVRVGNGAIAVDEPTVSGNSLNTSFTVTNKTAGFYIEVSGTDEGNYLHHLADESWSSPAPYSEQQADGSQFVYLPNAGEGSSARIQTLPLEVLPDTGDVNVEVENASKPQFRVTPGSTAGDDVQFTYHDTETGETYVLYSLADEVVRDSDEAESPVYLWTDDGEDVLTILVESSGSTSFSGAGGGGGGIGPIDTSSPLNSVPVVLLAALLGVTGVGLVLRKTVDEQTYVAGGTAAATVIALVAIGEWRQPGVVLGPIGENLGRMTPVITLVVVVSAAYYFYVRFIRGYGPGYGGGGK